MGRGFCDHTSHAWLASYLEIATPNVCTPTSALHPSRRHEGWASARNYCTATVSVAVFAAPPPLAVIVAVAVVPETAVDAAFSVNVLLPVPGDAMLAGANVAVTPFGRPLITSVTAAENPFTPDVETVSGIDPPRGTLTLVPATPSVKFGPTTVSFTVLDALTPPPDPPTVTV